MDESRKEMMEDIASTVHALCDALQDGCDDEIDKRVQQSGLPSGPRLFAFEFDTIRGTLS